MIAIQNKITTNIISDFDFADHIGFDRDYSDIDFGDCNIHKIKPDQADLDPEYFNLNDIFANQTINVWLRTREREVIFGGESFYKQSDFERASRLVGAELIDCLEKFSIYLKKSEAYKLKIDKKFDREAEEKKPKLAATILKSTTGTGKTHHNVQMVAQAYSMGVPVVITVRDHNLGNEFEAKLKALNIPVRRHYGRSKPEELWTEKRPHPGKSFVCLKEKAVALAAKNNQRPAQAICQNCEFGKRRSLIKAEEKKQQILITLAEIGKHNEKTIQKSFIEKRINAENSKAEVQFEIDELKKWFKDNAKFNIKIDVDPCTWLDELEITQSHPVIIIPYQSFSDGMAKQVISKKGEKRRTRQRLVVIDESTPVGTAIECGFDQFTFWLSSIEARRKNETKQEIIDGYDAAKKAFEICKDELGKTSGKDTNLSKKGLDELKTLAIVHGKAVIKSGTAKWERPTRSEDIESEHEFITPLRASTAIFASVAAGAIKINKEGKIVVFEINPVVKYLASGGSGGILMDATPSRAMRLLITRGGGEIKEIITKQHIKLIRNTNYYFGRGKQTVSLERKTREAQQNLDDAANLIKINFPENYKDVGAIIQKVYRKYEVILPEGAENWGHWGKDHIGTDKFKHKNLCIFGTHLPSPKALKSLYNIDRAALLQAGIQWPEWDDEEEEKVYLKEREDGDEVFCRALPKDEICRAWLLDFVLILIVQAIGRVRGASWDPLKKPLEVHIFGGMPLIGLQEHGLQIDEYRRDRVRDSQPDAMAKINGKRHEEAQERYKDAQVALAEALDSLKAIESRITERNLQSALDSMGAQVPQLALRLFLRNLRAN